VLGYFESSAYIHEQNQLSDKDPEKRHKIIGDMVYTKQVRYSGVGKELRVLAPQGMLHEILGKLQSIFTEANARVNDSCGLHIHLDMRHRDFNLSVNRLLDNREVMRGLVDPKRIKNDFCKPLDRKLVRSKSTNISRYRDINIAAYHKFKTVEVRLHEGTIDMTKVFMFTKFLVSVVDGIKFDKELKDYVKQTSQTIKEAASKAS
jgi:hypothetical protein